MIIGFRTYEGCDKTEKNVNPPKFKRKYELPNICGSIFYDINAYGKPNKLGSDQFIIPFDKRGIKYIENYLTFLWNGAILAEKCRGLFVVRGMNKRYWRIRSERGKAGLSWWNSGFSAKKECITANYKIITAQLKEILEKAQKKYV